MKSRLLVATLLCFITSILFGQATDKEAILKLAKSETEAYLKANLAEWQSFRIKSPEASITFVGRAGYNYLKGWDSINKTFIEILKGMPKMTFNVTISNPVIKVNSNLAWAEYNQVISSTIADSTVKTFSNEMRLLSKENGKWKILTQVTTNTSPPREDEIENTLNTTGYKLLAANKLTDAIEVFKLNVKLHPNAWNPYDSLGEAYALAGNNDMARENYEMSIKLNPKNESGITALKKLTGNK